jgi:hypothetical protein
MRFFLCCWAIFSFATSSYGQFTTIYNIPPNPNIGDGQSIGSDTQVNLFDGGEIGESFRAGVPRVGNMNMEVNIFGGSVGDDFDTHVGSVVNIVGGSVNGHGFNAYRGSTVNISGGSVGDHFRAHVGSVVNISGGSVGGDFAVVDGGTVNISGGSVGAGFRFNDANVNISGGSVGDDIHVLGSTVNISDGTLGDYISVNGDSVVNIFGGSFGGEFVAEWGSTINLFGTQFLVNNRDITNGLRSRGSVVFGFRNATLSGLFSDGSPFAFDLNSISPDAILTMTLVLPGDTNADGRIDTDDLNNVRNDFGESGNADGTLAGDAIPWDGVVDIDDLNAVRNNFGASVEAVPEPCAALFLGIGATCWLSLRRRCRQC